MTTRLLPANQPLTHQDRNPQSAISLNDDLPTASREVNGKLMIVQGESLIGVNRVDAKRLLREITDFVNKSKTK